MLPFLELEPRGLWRKFGSNRLDDGGRGSTDGERVSVLVGLLCRPWSVAASSNTAGVERVPVFAGLDLVVLFWSGLSCSDLSSLSLFGVGVLSLVTSKLKTT